MCCKAILINKSKKLSGTSRKWNACSKWLQFIINYLIWWLLFLKPIAVFILIAVLSTSSAIQLSP